MNKPCCKYCNSTINIVRDMHLWWGECHYCNRTYQVSEDEYISDYDRQSPLTKQVQERNNSISYQNQEVSYNSKQ